MRTGQVALMLHRPSKRIKRMLSSGNHVPGSPYSNAIDSQAASAIERGGRGGWYRLLIRCGGSPCRLVTGWGGGIERAETTGGTPQQGLCRRNEGELSQFK